MPWLAAHNPEIDWEKGEIKMTRCPPLCGKSNKVRKDKEKKEAVRRRQARRMEEEKAINWAADEKEDWGKRGGNGAGSSKNRRNGAKEIPLMVESVWEGGVRKNASEKSLGPCNRSQGGLQRKQR